MMDIATVEENAMRLRDSDRALLADRLLRSITQVSPDIEEAWNEEATSRLSAYREGRIEAVDGKEAMDSLLERFSG